MNSKLPPLPLVKPSIPVREETGTVPLPKRKPTVPVGGSEVAAGAPRGMEQFVDTARSVARIANVPFADVLAKAQQESNFNPQARSRTSSAAGAYQFIEQTWLNMVKRHGSAYGLGSLAAQIHTRNGANTVSDPAVRKQILDLRLDPHLSAGMAARYLDESGKDLKRSIHREPTENERRMSYVLGPGGAAKLIRAASGNPAGSAAALLPAAAQANRPLFYDTGGRALSNQEAMAKISKVVSRGIDTFSRMPEDNSPLITDQMNGESSIG
ncbi:hypothetical protein WCLP8_1070006 [uncultured Gammaproteobacteria bacterium]